MTPPAQDSTSSHLKAWVAAALRYLKARLSLAGVEGKEAAAKFGIAAALAVGGLVFVILGYLLLVVTLVFALAALFEYRHAWISILGVAALLHLGGGAGLFILARRRAKGGAFPNTIDEIRKDQSWLKH